MRVQIVGAKGIDYFSQKKNRQVVGIEIHCIDLGTKKADLLGHEVFTKYIPAESEWYRTPIDINGVYTLYMNGYSVDYLNKEEAFSEDSVVVK